MFAFTIVTALHSHKALTYPDKLLELEMLPQASISANDQVSSMVCKNVKLKVLLGMLIH